MQKKKFMQDNKNVAVLLLFVAERIKAKKKK